MRWEYFDLSPGDVYIVMLFYLTHPSFPLPLSLSPFHPLSLHFLLLSAKGPSHWPPVVLGEVVEDVHFVVVLQQAVRCTDVVTLQHWAVIVQDSCVWPVKEKAIVSHWLLWQRTAYRGVRDVDWMLLQCLMIWIWLFPLAHTSLRLNVRIIVFLKWDFLLPLRRPTVGIYSDKDIQDRMCAQISTNFVFWMKGTWTIFWRAVGNVLKNCSMKWNIHWRVINRKINKATLTSSLNIIRTKVSLQCVWLMISKGMELIWIPVLPQYYYCTAGNLGVNVKLPCCKWKHWSGELCHAFLILWSITLSECGSCLWSPCAHSRALLLQRSWQRSQARLTSAGGKDKKKKGGGGYGGGEDIKRHI